jgi:hypothetical protein
MCPQRASSLFIYTQSRRPQNDAYAKAAYQDFLTLWKDADPDIPILIAAKAEYAKLL